MSDETPGFTRRQKALLVLAGVLLAAALPAVVVGVDFLSGYNTATAGGHIAASNGPDVKLGHTVQLRAGNPTSTNAVNLTTEGNNSIVFSSPAPTAVQIDTIDGTWVEVSGLDVSGAALTIDHQAADRPPISVRGNTETFAYRSGIAVNDGTPDFRYSGSTGTSNVTVRDVEPSVRIKAVDTTSGQGLDVGVANADGNVTFDSLPHSSHTVELVTEAAPLYDSAPVVVDNDSWTDGREDVSLDNVSSYAVSVGPFVIGSGTSSGGDPLPGPLVTGLLIFGTIVAMVGPSRVGVVAGAVLGTVTAATLVQVGLAPLWMLAVVAMALALLVAAVWLRVVR